jgi:hypothetical protein
MVFPKAESRNILLFVVNAKNENILAAQIEKEIEKDKNTENILARNARDAVSFQKIHANSTCIIRIRTITIIQLQILKPFVLIVIV